MLGEYRGSRPDISPVGKSFILHEIILADEIVRVARTLDRERLVADHQIIGCGLESSFDCDDKIVAVKLAQLGNDRAHVRRRRSRVSSTPETGSARCSSPPA